MQLTRRLKTAINTEAGEDLFKQDNGAGRPRFLVIEAQKFCKILLTEFTGPSPHERVHGAPTEAEKTPLSSKDEFFRDLLIKGRVEIWFSEVKRGAARSTSMVDEEDQVRVAPGDAPPTDSSTNGNLKLWSHYPSRTVIQFLCHKWAAVTGEHADFVTATQLGLRIEHSYHQKVAMSTLCLWLDKEKNAYSNWKNNTFKEGDLKPILSKGTGLLPLLALASTAEKAENLIKAELCKAREHSATMFTLEMRAELKRECEGLKDIPGFCTYSVSIIAADVYARSIGELAGISWMPSTNWVLDFLHTDIGLKLRRVTGALR